jgi:hypothetical protein
MGLTKYSDFGKKSSDTLGSDYYSYDRKLTVKSKASNGVVSVFYLFRASFFDSAHETRSFSRSRPKVPSPARMVRSAPSSLAASSPSTVLK